MFTYNGGEFLCAQLVSLLDSGLMQRIFVLTRIFTQRLSLQNIASGCTMMLNSSAAKLPAGSEPPAIFLHDRWRYLLMAPFVGTVLVDDGPTAIVRQHDGNMIGAQSSTIREAVAALRCGPRILIIVRILREHVAALATRPHAKRGAG